MRLIVLFTLFTYCGLVQATPRYYFTKSNDTIESIGEEIFAPYLSDEELYEQISLLQKNNPHIKNWRAIIAGEKLDLKGLKLREVQEISVSPKDKNLDHLPLWRLKLTWLPTNFTFLDNFNEVEVQADTYSMSNYGLAFRYAYSKSYDFHRFDFGYKKYQFKYFSQNQYHLDIFKNHTGEFYLLGASINYRELSYDTLNSQFFRVIRNKELFVLNFMGGVNYFVANYPALFTLQLGGVIVDNSGNGDSGVSIKFANLYELHQNFSVKPYIDYLKVTGSNDSEFLLFGVEMNILVNIL